MAVRWALRIGFLSVAAALSALGVGAAWAAGSAATSTTTTTTPTDTTTTTTTTTGTTETTTTSTTTPSYAELPSSVLGTACVGAGAAAVVLPSQRVITLGTPASSLGPSTYRTAAGSVLSFESSSAWGATCTSAGVTLNSLSLFDGAVYVASVRATVGSGTVGAIEIDGSPVAAAAGGIVSVGGWGTLTLGAVVGRVRAPLVLRLLQARGSLPAGTVIALAFAAEPAAKPKPAHRVRTGHKLTRPSSARHAHRSENHRRSAMWKRLDFPVTPDPFLFGDALAQAVERNPVVSIAMRYLGVPYRWAGASPKAGFDCSGLVKYVFAKLGVVLPHYAAAQYYLPDAVPVSPEHLQAGDLVFFTGSDGTRKSPGHVGIYIGDGFLIDAPHTGAFVEVDSLDARWFAKHYVGARRIGFSLDHRRLLAVRREATSEPDIRAILLAQMVEPAFAQRLSTVAYVSAAHSSAPRTAEFSAAGGVLVLLTGAFAIRRRRRTSPAGADSPD